MRGAPGIDGQPAWHDAALVLREDLRPGDLIAGPAIIAEQNATTVVEPGWQAALAAFDHLLLERRLPRPVAHAVGTTVDTVRLEVFNKLFMNIAEQMGLQLQNTAYSVNIKERLDFSCALFDADGNLIANAPHMPVHLGSMGESIKTVIRENRASMRPGDVYVLNDPYHGGTHLPDITVITPVYLDDGSRPTFFVGSRGHHADVDGITPGSMPPFSTRIEEEGVQIHNFKLVDGGVLREAEMLALLQGGAYPSRNPQQNLADLKAQIAANEKGVQELRKMVDQFGLAVVQTHMTNSRLTDPEVLEFRFPVRLDFGLAGGQPGAPGLNRVLRADGRVEELGHIAQTEMQPGDVFEIHTPGGGGYGAPERAT